MDFGQQSIQGFQNESASTDPQVIPAANEMNVLSPSCFLPMNEYEEIMALIGDENDNSQEDKARKKSKTLSEEENSLPNLFQPDQPLSLEEIFGPEETLPSEAQVGGSSSHVPRDVAPQTVITNTSSFGQRSSSGLVQQLRGNMGVVNSIFSSENCSNSSLPLPENNPKFWPAGSIALYPPQAGTSFGDFIFPNTTGNSFTQFESPNFPVHPYGCATASFGTGASASGLVGNQFQSPSLVHPYTSPSAGSGSGANNLDGNSHNEFQSPSLVYPCAGPSYGSGAGANNLDGNSLTLFQSPSFVHPYYAGSGVGANNLDGNSLIQYQSPSLVHLYAGPSVGANNLDGNSLTKFQSPSFPVHSYVGPSAGSSRIPVVGTAVTHYQSSSFPVHPYGSASAGGIACAGANASASADASGFAGAANANVRPYGSHQQFIRDHRLEINPLAAPSAMGASPVPTRPQYYNQTQFISRQPFLRDFNDFDLVWKGCLVEEASPYRTLFNEAKAWKKSISPFTLTEWSSTLKVSLFVPSKAVISTMRVYGGPVDYIFFQVTQFGSVDLHSHLLSEKTYAKIPLPSHTLILFTTENKHYFLGLVFKGDTVVVEHVAFESQEEMDVAALQN